MPQVLPDPEEELNQLHCCTGACCMQLPQQLKGSGPTRSAVPKQRSDTDRKEAWDLGCIPPLLRCEQALQPLPPWSHPGEPCSFAVTTTPTRPGLLPGGLHSPVLPSPAVMMGFSQPLSSVTPSQ